MNLDEEIRNGYTVSTEMKKVWAVELQLLHKLLEVCNKYNLRIVATGGTCIGAVREHGFIPWDDDIDMEMLRADYDKLVSVAEKEFKAPYFFQCWQTEDKFPGGHAKLRLSSTTAIMKNDSRKINHGIFLDIFVLDAVPCTNKEIEELKTITISIKNYLFGYSYFDWTFSRGLGIQSLFSWMYVKLKGYRTLSKKLEDIFRSTSFDDAEEVASMAFNWDQFERVRRSKHMMDKIIWLPFEDTLMPVPAIYDEILSKHFGDYMKPVKGGALHDGFAVLDPNLPYTKYIKDIITNNKKESIKRKITKVLHYK